MQLKSKIDSIFDGRVFDLPLYYSYAGGLRFELSEGGAPLDQVLTAMRKASVLCEDIFSGAELITVCLRRCALQSRFSHRDCLRELRIAGITIGSDRSTWQSAEACPAGVEFGSEESVVTVAFELPKASLQNLLWCAFAGHFSSLHPNPHCEIYLFNLERGVVAFPYDHRGMDVVGVNKKLLRELYLRHNRLLLDYDRASMDASFRLVGD